MQGGEILPVLFFYALVRIACVVLLRMGGCLKQTNALITQMLMQ